MVIKTPSTRVFISYSHKDRQWLRQLQIHLRSLDRLGLIVECWDDSKIRPGQNWLDEILRELTGRSVAVLLLSAEFLASHFISETELPTLVNATKENGLVVLPVHISPCRFDLLPEFQSVNDPNKPMVDLKKGDRDRVWVKLTYEIERIHHRGDSGGMNGSPVSLS